MCMFFALSSRTLAYEVAASVGGHDHLASLVKVGHFRLPSSRSSDSEVATMTYALLVC